MNLSQVLAVVALALACLSFGMACFSRYYANRSARMLAAIRREEADPIGNGQQISPASMTGHQP